MITLKNILLPTDFSKESNVAMPFALDFARRFGASLHLLHVVEDYVALGLTAEVYAAMPPGFLEEREREAMDRLSTALSEADREKLDVRLAVATGSPFLEIVRYAEEHGIDLIVMGTHGRGAVAHALMGSVAEKVVRKAPCPVLAVRRTPAAAAAEAAKTAPAAVGAR